MLILFNPSELGNGFGFIWYRRAKKGWLADIKNSWLRVLRRALPPVSRDLRRCGQNSLCALLGRRSAPPSALSRGRVALCQILASFGECTYHWRTETNVFFTRSMRGTWKMADRSDKFKYDVEIAVRKMLDESQARCSVISWETTGKCFIRCDYFFQLSRVHAFHSSDILGGALDKRQKDCRSRTAGGNHGQTTARQAQFCADDERGWTRSSCANWLICGVCDWIKI